jgi:hypothetical protein
VFPFSKDKSDEAIIFNFGSIKDTHYIVSCLQKRKCSSGTKQPGEIGAILSKCFLTQAKRHLIGKGDKQHP